MGHSLYSTYWQKTAHICVHATWVGPCQLRPPSGSLTLSKWRLACCPSTFLSNTPQSPHRHGAHPCVPKLQKPNCQEFPLPLPEMLTQVGQLCLSTWSGCTELSHIRRPLRMLPWAFGYSCATLYCTTGLVTKGGPTVLSLPLCQRYWVLQGCGVLVLMLIYIALVLPGIPAH